MNLSARLVIVGVLAVGGFFGVRALQSNPDTAPEEAVRRWQSAQDCKGCHERRFAEWHGSHHQIVYTNPEVRRLSDDFRIKDCQACHLPRPIASTGFGNRTLPRQTMPSEGVSCLTCHLDTDGSIMARNTVENAPCRPRAHAEFTTAKMCSSCHNQHKTTDQWAASEYASEGVTCNDCHMPDGSHVFPGAHDEAMLRKASELEIQTTERSVQLTLNNVGAGHNFPTEERHRAVDLVVRFPGTTDEAWQRVHRFRQPYRDEPGENTQLPARTKQSFTVDIPPGATKVQVRVWYRLNPYAKDSDPASTLIHEREVALP